MKKIGELLSEFFEPETIKKAEGYHRLFSSWEAIAGEHVASHSRIVDLNRAVLLVEADHPGWIQILQTRQKALLVSARRRFPELDINGIAFRLGRDSVPVSEPEKEQDQEVFSGSSVQERESGPEVSPEVQADPFSAVEDPVFREKLRRFSETAKKKSGYK